MHLSLQIGPTGPMILAQISPSQQRAAALAQAGLPVPQPVVANLLVDTGASITALDPKIVAQLGLTATGTTPMHTPSTGGQPHVVSLYDISLALLNNVGQRYTFPALAVTACNFAAQQIDGLLGRDVLSNARMIYAGADGFVLLSF